MITFRGHSDDIVMIEGNGKGEDEFYGPHDKEIFATFIVGGQMRIHAIYHGTWCFAIDLIDEDIPLPDWPIKFHMDGYSAVLEIDTPADVRVFQEQRDD